jgi:hypothetical protein
MWDRLSSGCHPAADCDSACLTPCETGRRASIRAGRTCYAMNRELVVAFLKSALVGIAALTIAAAAEAVHIMVLNYRFTMSHPAGTIATSLSSTGTCGLSYVSHFFYVSHFWSSQQVPTGNTVGRDNRTLRFAPKPHSLERDAHLQRDLPVIRWRAAAASAGRPEARREADRFAKIWRRKVSHGRSEIRMI